ncbi:DUF397 domain-containing protein [Spirillospora sp. NPDC048832]
MTGTEVSISRGRKSPRSGGGGSECVEVAAMWRKGSYSGSVGQECVEVAALTEQGVALRDSKDVDGPILSISSHAWTSLLAGIKEEALDIVP